MKRGVFGVLVGILLISLIFVSGCANNSNNQKPYYCEAHKDCVVRGEQGDCNCGCFNKDYNWKPSKEQCFCASPETCACVNNQCFPTIKNE